MTEDHDPYRISSVRELRQLYDMPTEMILKAKFTFLDDYSVDFIRLAPFVCIGSEMGEGVDVSPRGGEAGFVKVLDRRSVAIPDWPGNNKLETITNIIETGRCALVFLVPGRDMFLRANGSAKVTRNPDILKLFVTANKTPKLAIMVSLKDVYFHCGKAIKRSKIWNPDKWPDSSSLPTAGKMIMDQIKLADTTPEEVEEMYQKDLKENLY